MNTMKTWTPVKKSGHPRLSSPSADELSYNTRPMKHVLGALAASFVAAIAVLLLSWTNYFEQLNLAAYDFTLRLAGPVRPVSPTVIVAIDEESLARVGSWPWSRDKLARILGHVERDRPLTVGVDLVLQERTAPAADSELAAAISSIRSIVLAARIDLVDGREQWRRPISEFIQDATRLGHVHADPDFDGISRRFLSAKAAGGVVIPAFAAEMLHSAGVPIQVPFERKIAGANVLLPQPVNIRFAGDNGSFPRVPAWQVLDGVVPAGMFKDRIVLVGSTSEGLGDQWFTPFSMAGQRMSGVEIHANAIETLFAGSRISETSDIVVLFILFVWIALLWWLDRRFEGRRFFTISLLMVPGIVTVSWLLMKSANIWFPFPDILAALVFVVPGLEVAKLVLVNRDLDAKIERLSGWFSDFRMYSPPAADVVRRKRLFGEPHMGARWKLDAVDFFNEELIRFISFNSAILSSIQDVIIVSDPEGRVAYQNAAAQTLDGFHEYPPPAPEYFMSLLNSPTLARECDSVMASGTPLKRESVPSRNGKNFYHVTLSPISQFGLVMSLHDVTAQHELNQAKNDMVSLVSHELRTPLTSIRGYSDMLMKYDLVQEKGKRFIGTIVEESQRLNQLIQSFLDIAYIESGRQKLTVTTFEVEPVLNDILRIVEPAASQKQITVTFESPGISVKADRMLLYQALSNLIVNAIKYSPPERAVRILVTNDNGRARFSVADQGYGIPAAETSRVFEKFYRRANRETHEQSGFGLGLAFVKEVATRHGGNVIVESEPGKGSVFTLWIPN
jgi:CHASE2 domain-containing sensor protein/signal transduction histidine kinase